MHFRLGHNLHQRRARSIKINAARGLKMHVLRHIFFQMDTMDSHPHQTTLIIRLDLTTQT